MTIEPSVSDWDPRQWPSVGVKSARECRTELRLAVARLRAQSSENPAEFAREARRIGRSMLPTRLAEKLLNFDEFGQSALLLTDLAVGPIPATPPSLGDAPTADTFLAKQAAVIMCALGHLVGYRAESDGALIQNLFPLPADVCSQTSTGSRAELECHSEQAFNLRTRPDYLGLACLRGARDAATFLLSACELQSAFTAEEIELLREPAFYTRIDESFLRGGAPDEIRGPVPVLSGTLEDPSVTYDQDLMFATSPAHRRVLQRVSTVWQERRQEVVLAPGQLLIVDNSRSIHGRSSFEPRFDGTDRWLLRLQVQVNYASGRFARTANSPIIENFGV